MLGSLNSRSRVDQQENEPSSDLARQPTFTTSAVHMRQLLINCAQLISQSDFSAAGRTLSILASNSSPYGDSTERLVHEFVRALSLRLHRLGASSVLTNYNIHPHDLSLGGTDGNSSSSSRVSTNYVQYYNYGEYSSDHHQDALHSCYLSLNQITPFIRFSHLTANQAILEAIQVGHHEGIHIIDLDIMHGVQWPPLMQALADRYSTSTSSTHTISPMLRITGTGNDSNILRRTGDRLLKFAQSLGLRFQFHPLLLLNNDPTSLAFCLPSAITLLPDEALAVNCVLYLHTLLKDDSEQNNNSHALRVFLHKIKSLNPMIVTIAEREASHNHPLFLHRFVDALDHYAALFDSLEATLPPRSTERLAVEQIWFGREIMDIVAAEGDARRQRHQRFQWWEMMLRSTGFSHVPLSPFALSQAKLLLRLHYPSEGYRLHIQNTSSFFLGWQNRALFSISSWH